MKTKTQSMIKWLPIIVLVICTSCTGPTRAQKEAHLTKLNEAHATDLSPDEKYYARLEGEKLTNLRVYSIDTNEPVAAITLPYQVPLSGFIIGWTPENRYLVVAESIGKCAYFRVVFYAIEGNELKESRVYPLEKGCRASLSLSESGNWFSIDTQRETGIYDLEGNQIQLLKFHEWDVATTVWTKDGLVVFLNPQDYKTRQTEVRFYENELFDQYVVVYQGILPDGFISYNHETKEILSVERDMQTEEYFPYILDMKTNTITPLAGYFDDSFRYDNRESSDGRWVIMGINKGESEVYIFDWKKHKIITVENVHAWGMPRWSDYLGGFVYYHEWGDEVGYRLITPGKDL